MSTFNPPAWLDERIESLFGGELDSLEGERDAVELWNYLKTDQTARKRYDAVVYGMRALAQQKGVRTFHDAEAEALLPVIMGMVSDDARVRSGLSKQALSHLAVPELVASISKALTNFSQPGPADRDQHADMVFAVDVPNQGQASSLDFSIAAVAGEVSLRLYRDNQDLDVHCRVENNEVRANVPVEDVANWEQVTAALNQLSTVTANLLGEKVLVQGHIAIHDGRAEVRVNPMNLLRMTK